MNLSSIYAELAGQLWAVSPERWAIYKALMLAHVEGGDQRGLVGYADDETMTQRRNPEETKPQAGVGVLPVYGDLCLRSSPLSEYFGFGTSTLRLGQRFRALHADPAVGSILLDIHSPGGSVFGVHELYTLIASYRGQGKKIVASVNALAASGAYWIACAADEIVGTPSGEAGSIGVYTAHTDISKALEKAGVHIEIIAAGKHKAEGHESQPLSEDARQAIEERAFAIYDLFVADVAEGRKTTPGKVKAGFGQGRTLPMKVAKAEGLVDRIGTFDDTVRRLLGAKGRAATGARADGDGLELDAGGAGATGTGEDNTPPVDVPVEPPPVPVEEPEGDTPEELEASAAGLAELGRRMRLADLDDDAGV